MTGSERPMASRPALRKHAALSGFPADAITEVTRMLATERGCG